MTTITLSISKELKTEMELFPEINWSEVARGAFKQKIADLKFLREFKAQSEITPEDAERLGREISANLAKRYKGSK